MISLIIPTYNKLPRLKLTLASINFQTIDRSSFEVIVVNDNSSDGTKEYLETQSFPFRIRGLHLSDNKGRSAARNEGLGKAQGDIVIFVDDDLILSPEYLKNHVLLQKECPRCVHGKIIDIFPLAYFKDPSKGILYETIDESRKMDNFKKRCISVEDIFNDFERKIARYKTTSFMEETIHKILEREESKYHWIGMTGGNFCCPKEWVIEAGGFDENLGKEWGCEDFELGYRLCKKYPIIYSDQCVNYHISHYRYDLNEKLKKAFSYFYKKHKDEEIVHICRYLLKEIDYDKLFT